MKRATKNIIIAALACSMLPFAATCSDAGRERPRGAPKYILNGELDGTEGNFDYYDLGDGTYAVGLNKSVRDTDLTSIVIPDTYKTENDVVGIWRYGFADNPTASITIPSSIQTIDYEAFLGSKITEIVIPSSVEELGEGAFYGCRDLTTVTFRNTDKDASSGGSANVCTIDDGEDDTPPVLSTLAVIPSFCFFNCVSLTSLLLPSSITEIEYEAFNGCYNLSSALSFSNIRAIRSRAFQGCKSLTTVYIPESFFSNGGVIEPHAFNYCASQANITFNFAINGLESGVFDDWEEANPNWGWYNDRSSPVGNSYTYTATEGNAFISDDWSYTTTVEGGVAKITINSYIGRTDGVTYLTIPNTMEIANGNTADVAYIAEGALDSLKTTLQRLYLPTTLKRVENHMFDGFTSLVVIDSNDGPSCTSDVGGSFTKRIDIHKLLALEVIGDHAFSGLSLREEITKIHLPKKLKAVGSYAFCYKSGNDYRWFRKVTDFIWDYSDADSQLEFIGSHAFFKLGLDFQTGSGEFVDNKVYVNRYANDDTDGTKTNYRLTTLVFPKTFKHFGFTSDEAKTYSLSHIDDPSSSFAGCPLLETVIFKGTDNAGEALDLVIPIGTFTFNCSLRNVWFEERNGKSIVFHTRNGNGVCIGASSGDCKNDFRGDPGIQSIILPNSTTKLVFQKFALQANSRAAIYLSAGTSTNLFANTNTSKATQVMSSRTTTAISDASNWNLIGNETFENGHYRGYCFDSTVNAQTLAYKNSFGISQYLPLYGNVKFSQSVSVTDVLSTTFSIGSANTNLLTFESKCAFVSNTTSNKATLANYLYDRYDPSFSGTARIPKYANTNCEVNAIGASAFSACYSDGVGETYDGAHHKDLTAVEIPDSIATIGDYAFIRAYGITKLTAYDTSTLVNHADYTMPSNLGNVGKGAFMFTSIAKFLDFPTTTVFYENANNVFNVPSVFANNLMLRHITFKTGTNRYTTTTYNSGTCTSALYSTNNASVTYNKNRLLIVLNRDEGDKGKTSEDLPTTGDTADFFNGNYKTNPYLYGAFKMGFWIERLKLGAPTKDSSNKVYDQALFSAVYNKTVGNEATIAPIYLHHSIENFENAACNLTTVQDSGGSLAAYSFAGCENLHRIRISANPGGTFTAGLLKGIESTTIFFETPDGSGGWKNSAEDDSALPGVLDLTHTGHTAIGTDAFNGNAAVKKFVAPAVANLTINNNAFKSCSNLTEIDFRNVTGTISIKQSAFESSKATTIRWGNAEVEIGKYSFKSCGSLTELNLPKNLKSLGEGAFESCSKLTSVRVEGGVNMINSSFTTISKTSFKSCSNLESFSFDKMPYLTTLGPNSFESCGSIGGDDGVVFPHNITTFQSNCFLSSAVKKVTFQCQEITIGDSAFNNMKKLTHVMFTDVDCVWNNSDTPHTQNLFSSSTNLTHIFLPTTFNLNWYNTNSTSAVKGCSYVWGDNKVDFYFWGIRNPNDNNNTVGGGENPPQGRIWWCEKAARSYCPVHYYVGRYQDVLKKTDYNDPNTAWNELIDSTAGTSYWAMVNGEALKLGSSTSIVDSIDYIVFSNGYYLYTDGTITTSAGTPVGTLAS